MWFFKSVLDDIFLYFGSILREFVTHFEYVHRKSTELAPSQLLPTSQPLVVVPFYGPTYSHGWIDK